MISPRAVDYDPAMTLRWTLLAVAVLALRATADTEFALPAPLPAGGVPGRILIADEASDAVVRALVDAAGGDAARLVVTADEPRNGGSRDRLRGVAVDSVTRVPRDAALGPKLEDATGVLLTRPPDAAARGALAAFLQRDGVLAAVGPAAAALSKGPELLPGTVVRTGVDLAGDRDALLGELEVRPGHVAYATEPGAGLWIRGRRAEVVLSGRALVALAPSATRGPRFDLVSQGGRIDLVAQSRAAIARAGEPYPPPRMAVPRVEKGTLVIVGGGLTREILARFLDAAGGSDDARVVVIPTALGEPLASRGGHGRVFENAGVRDVRVVHATTPAEAARPEVLDALRRATGIWFTGGRQWRIVDGFEGTEAKQLMHGMLARGGVIGGSSAGATIQGDYLVRGNPLGNTDMMAEGYERGFAFLPGVAIDQHFTQRGRLADMQRVKETFPQILGLGIDERTAAIVRGSLLEVVGDHRVFVLDRMHVPEASREHTILEPGDRYDLVARERLERR